MIMESDDVKTQIHQNCTLVSHRGFNLISGTHDPDEVDQIYNLDIRDSDVFVVTYPKSGEEQLKAEKHTRRHTLALL